MDLVSFIVKGITQIEWRKCWKENWKRIEWNIQLKHLESDNLRSTDVSLARIRWRKWKTLLKDEYDNEFL